LDEDVEPGVIYYYNLEELDTGGAATNYGPMSASVAATGEKPTERTGVAEHTIFLPIVRR
jgi:hypothetical protein